VSTYLTDEYGALLESQHGVIARWQIREGRAVQMIDAQLRLHRWQPLYRGVYAAFTGPPPRLAVLWAAVLRAGPGAALSHGSAAELDDLADRPCWWIDVSIASGRQARIPGSDSAGPYPRIRIHRSSRIGQARHPVRTPPRTRIEETALDLTQAATSVDEALSWLARACSRRLTTPELLQSALAQRDRVRWRGDLTAALSDIGDGAHSLLESRYVRRVERRHGLPVAARQAVTSTGGQTRYLDNLYRQFGVAVELDGQVAHPVEARWRDIHRDNSVAAAGIITLRYSWADVSARPCRVAAEVARVLRLGGWTGQPRPCGPDCPAAPGTGSPLSW